MYVAVARSTGGKLRDGRAALAELTVNAKGLFLCDVLVTGIAVDGIEAGPPVPAVVGANVAFETFRAGMGRDRQVTGIVVAVQTGVFLLGITCLRRKQEARNTEG
jgi:hypothetical protein